MTVVVPFDESEQARFALQHAANRFSDRTITLLHVLDPFASEPDATAADEAEYAALTREAQASLDDTVSALPGNVDTRTVVRYGRPTQEILHYVETNDVEHVVIGSHGRDGVTRLFLGSVAETVVRRAPVPVTVVREASAAAVAEFASVLVPFDGSRGSQNALRYALDRYPGASVTALYVAFPSRERTDPAVHESPNALADWAGGLDALRADILELAESVAENAGGTVSSESVMGHPPQEIVAYAEETEVDHIVIGSHGREGLTRLLLGSVAERVVRRAPTSVTVVR